MRQTCVLEPFHPNEKDEEDEGKIYWEQIKKYLDNYKLGLDVEETFDNMLENLNMNEEQYIKGIQSSIARVQFFLHRKPCEVRINNYMKNCLHIWRANHDIQPTLSPHAVIEYILSYVTKGQKGMSIQMEHACKEAKKWQYGS